MNELTSEISFLLQDVSRLPQRREHNITFLEIAGYPHLENVASNILEFYLQSSNPHNLDNILFRSFMTILDSDIVGEYLVTARREDITAKNKRIDLVIETDDVVIGIENKIYHYLSNDLDIYWNHINSISNGRSVYGIVLSLHPVNMPSDESRFINITYQEFLNQVSSLCDRRDLSNNRYEIYFQDFCNTMIHLSRGTDMDYERLGFFQHHNQSINVLLNEIKHFREEIKSKLDNHCC